MTTALAIVGGIVAYLLIVLGVAKFLAYGSGPDIHEGSTMRAQPREKEIS